MYYKAVIDFSDTGQYCIILLVREGGKYEAATLKYCHRQSPLNESPYWQMVEGKSDLYQKTQITFF